MKPLIKISLSSRISYEASISIVLQTFPFFKRDILPFALCPLFFAFCFLPFAHSQNDNCSSAIPLTITPINGACPSTIYTNVGATDGTGSANSPIGSCFNGLKAFKDVWFSFTTGNVGFQNYKIQVDGVNAADSIRRPQLALYIGNCTDGLLQEFCQSQDVVKSSRSVSIDAGNMRPNTTYYIQVANFQSTDAGGRFNICVRPFDPIYNLTLTPQTSTAYQGTLYDTGGPIGNYSNNENESTTAPSNNDNYTFNIRPNGGGCIELNFESLNTEPNTDTITIFDGNTGAILDRLSGATNKQILYTVRTNWVKVQFRSDNSATGPGFKLNWRALTNCSLTTKATSCPSAEIIPSLPFSASESTCYDALNSIGQTPCMPLKDRFISGKDHVYKFSSKTNQCVSIKIGNIPTSQYSGQTPTIGAGLGLYRGCPESSTSQCIAQGKLSPFKDSLIIRNVSLDADDYYIVVGRKEACMPYSILVDTVSCLNVLPNAGYCDRALSINDCSYAAPSDMVLDLTGGGDTSFVSFTPNSINTGCIQTLGTIPPLYAFVFLTFKAQKDGQFAFTVGPINTGEASDIDFNVYGPIDSANQICSYAKTHFPTRSSYGQEGFFVAGKRTGLADTYLDIYGNTRFSTDTCQYNASDGILRPLKVYKDKYYVIWLNDYKGTIGKNGVRLSFEGTTPGVLDSVGDPLSRFTISKDTFICAGATTQLKATGGISYNWLPSMGLDNPKSINPLASPKTSTQYNVSIQGTCRIVNKSVKVGVFDIQKFADQTVCSGQKLQLTAGENFAAFCDRDVACNVSTWTWTSPTGNISELGATNIYSVAFVAKNTSGNVEKHTFIAKLNSPTCSFSDTINIFVNAGLVAKYEVITSPKIGRDTNICIGTMFNLLKTGFDATANYSWISNPSTIISDVNPKISPTANTKYYLTVTGGVGGCTATSYDSVIVNVYSPPVLKVAKDTTLCRDMKIKLGNTIIENQTTYAWSPNFGIDKPDNPNATLTVQPWITPNSSLQYVLTATNLGGCVTKGTIDIVGVDLKMKITPADSVRLCRNDTITLSATTSSKPNLAVKWSSNKDYNLADSVNSIRVNPTRVTKYYATISQSGCTRNDSVTVYVDSLPFNRMIVPQDTNICMNAIAVLRSPTFESVLFPKIKHLWFGGKGFLTPDSLYDMVIQGDTTRTYSRISTNGVCKAIDTVKVFVTPLPKVTLTPAQTTFCPGQETAILLSANIIPLGLTDIKWKDPQGQDIASAKGNSSYSVPAGNVGTYTITVKNGNCPASASASISLAPAPDFGTPKSVICAGNSVSLNTSPNGSYTYSWTGPNGFASTDPAPTVTPTAVSTYNVTINAGANKCTLTKSVTITPATANLAPIPDITVCTGNAATLTAVPTSNVSNLTYSWSTGGNTATISVAPKSSTTYTVTLTFGDNCTKTATANVNVLPNITVAIVPDTFAKFVDVGTNLKLDAIAIGAVGTPSYSWTSNGQVSSTTGNLTFGLVDDTKVIVTASTSNGCSASYSVNIQARFPNFQIPNAFTPNGDTINSNFNIIFSDGKNSGPPQVKNPTFWKGNLSVVSFQVFSRFGKALYEETNSATLNSPTYKGWDGTISGNDVAPDVYVYLIKLQYPDGSIKNASGELNLIR